MVIQLEIDDFLQKAASSVLLDVRTPAEYDLGHLPDALNFPLFSNEERVIVGTLYKQKSPEIAFEQGLEFVGPKMAYWVRQAKKQAKGGKPLCLYCWRGGKRSGSMAWLLDMAGFEVYLLVGGYKAYRNAFNELIEAHAWKFRILGGPTACGKTHILHEMRNLGQQVLDLEGLANHKGSAFGSYGLGAQPSNESFYNLLHQAFRQFDATKVIWCEGESMTIGKVNIPIDLFNLLQESPLFLFSIPMELRLVRILAEYGQLPKNQLIEAFSKIQKRLGREQCAQAIQYIEEDNLADAARIALKYYDKGYRKSIEKRTGSLIIPYESPVDQTLENAKKLIALL
ncbi:MAG: tRNA 2-selenouridine(34) synthase MnmH [Bacteroidales bacterium]